MSLIAKLVDLYQHIHKNEMYLHVGVDKFEFNNVLSPTLNGKSNGIIYAFWDSKGFLDVVVQIFFFGRSSQYFSNAVGVCYPKCHVNQG